jgi:hypothetical protein
VHIGKSRPTNVHLDIAQLQARSRRLRYRECGQGDDDGNDGRHRSEVAEHILRPH